LGNARFLWLNVLLQAVRDGCVGPTDVRVHGGKGIYQERYRTLIMSRSRAYFRLNNPDFLMVCELIGIAPEKVAAAAQRIFKAYDAGMKFAFEPWEMHDVLFEGPDRQYDTDAYRHESGRGHDYLRPVNARCSEAARFMD
jgi:hypothetical protein